MSDNLNPDQFKEYTKHYNAGWKHSSTASNPSMDNDVRYARKHGDDAGNAWGDGYLDAATGREKFALRGHRFGTGPKVEGY